MKLKASRLELGKAASASVSTRTAAQTPRQGRSSGNQGLAGLLPTSNVNDVWHNSDPARAAAVEPAPAPTQCPTGPPDADRAGEPSDDAPASGGAVEFYASLKHGLEESG